MMTPVWRDLPSGTVTFLFTDVEGSTGLLHELGADEYAQALAEHRRVLREAFGANGGVEVDTQGDAFFVAFPTAPGALEAAVEALAGLEAGRIRVRMGVHTGTPHVGEEGYVGVDVHRAARIAACGHGGQVLVSASTAALVGTDGLCDLGEHRLKDLSAPARIYQLGDADFPPLESLHRTNLPIPSTPFLGRERELSEVLGLLSQEEVRLLTLTGSGGTGKTRLGLQTAAELAARYPHGVWWVPLAPLRDPELVLATAAQVLGAKDGLAEHIADRSLLLLFDNFEQVVEAAADLAGLLASCPKLELLVTSREPLHVTGEQEYAVPPLVHEEGVGFFLARARAVKPDFAADEAVSEICRRLDDLPLALELAAARVKALSPTQILERLEQRLPLLTGGARDAPERQRTLRAAIAWSYELLTDDEQRLFARLAVFNAGCTLEAAEQVTDADLDTLASLVDKSLLRHSDERFWMLETTREYALERLEASGEAADLRRRHAEHFGAVAEEASSHLDDVARHGEWLDRLEADVDNLRSALAWAAGSGAGGLSLQIAASLGEFWYARGYYAEGLRWLEDALVRGSAANAMLRIRAIALALQLAGKAGNVEDEQRYAAMLRSYGSSAEAPLGAKSLLLLAHATSGAERRELLSAAVEQAITVGDLPVLARALVNLGLDELAAEKFSEAESLFREAWQVSTESGAERETARALNVLGLIHSHKGDAEHARHLHAEALRISQRIGFKEGQAYALEGLACAHAGLGDYNRAARHLADAAALEKEIGLRLDPHVERLRVGTAARVGENIDGLTTVVEPA